MCLAMPYKIKKIKNQTGWLNNGRRIKLLMTPRVKAGDWILAHKDLAISVLTQIEAEKIFKLINKCHHE